MSNYQRYLTLGFESDVHDCRERHREHPAEFPDPWVALYIPSGKAMGCPTRKAAREAYRELVREFKASSGQ